MTILFFGTDECSNCRILRALFNSKGYNYQYIDALDSKNDNVCEKYNVDQLPHIVVLDNNKVVFEKTGLFDISLLKTKVKTVFDINNLKKE